MSMTATTALPALLLRFQRLDDFEPIGQGTERAASVRDPVLLVGRHLGERPPVALDRHEERVVPETAVTASVGGDDPLDVADRRHLTAVGPPGERHRAEPRRARGSADPGEL